ncbi:MAG TPA: nucleoside-diphosphate sugar epimerase/dehydratase [Terriglobales bacterium]|nr:nucleoside-diphosphate sugar epimerase/dehydratase [Terriglobales bacterium]
MSRFNLLHGNWRYTGVHDSYDILGASVVGSLGFILSYRYVLGVREFPISVYVIEFLITAFFITAVRVGLRILAETAARVPITSARKQTLIIGAGFAAHMIIREIQGTPSDHWVVGCLDDNPKKFGSKILGKPVMGSVDQLPGMVSAYGIDEVLIAVPSATGAQMRRFVDVCQAAGVKFSTVPSLQDLISGKANIQQLRQVDLEDLLGRDPVEIDLESVRNVIEGKVVMVTGAAGSIGSELCRQLSRYEPAKLICLDQSETGLFYLEKELGRHHKVYSVADYTNSIGMQQEISHHRVHIIFHAAAYKHVPMMEENPREAIRNNVLGLKELLQVADESGCKEFILISSDKAVNPSSIMGATKRIGELMMCSRPKGKMRCVTVRFGNVLGSQGSVVPVFQKQLLEEKRITVTHPDINRFFMTIPEAASLVLQASAVGQQGDVLVLDMGEPIRIVDLARTLIRLSGKTEKEIPIVYTGLRPGEKLYEELFYSWEQVQDTHHDKIKRTQGQIIGWAELNARLEMLRRSIYISSENDLRVMVQSIIPEYQYGGPAAAAAAANTSSGYAWPLSSEISVSASAQD